MTGSNHKRITGKIKIFRTVAIVLVVFQVIGYLGSIKDPHSETGDTVQLAAYYLGFNIFLVISIILFISAASMNKKMKRMIEQEEIDSLGRNDSPDKEGYTGIK